MATHMDTRPAILKASQPFLVGGFSGCFATCVIQPIDMVKVQLQIMSPTVAKEARTPLAVARNVIQEQGPLALYKGLDAGLLRQITYTTTRLGLFRIMSEQLKAPGEKTLSLGKKAFAGLAAGGIGSLVGTPADLALIRLQSDASAPLHLRRGYTGVFDALGRIVKEEGVASLWKGAGPTVARAMALNMGMLASFDQTKEILERRIGHGASAVSGWFAVTFSLPFDFVKTKIQRMTVDPVTKQYPYKNMTDCAVKTLQEGGIRRFYTGYGTYYARIAPHIMIVSTLKMTPMRLQTLIVLDYANEAIIKFYRKPMSGSTTTSIAH